MRFAQYFLVTRAVDLSAMVSGTKHGSRTTEIITVAALVCVVAGCAHAPSNRRSVSFQFAGPGGGAIPSSARSQLVIFRLFQTVRFGR
jgi:hypothetical protein